MHSYPRKWNFLPRWLFGKEFACQYRTHKRNRFVPWGGKVHWMRKWQPTPVFLPRKSHGQRNWVDYNPWGHKELDMTKHTHTQYKLGFPKWSSFLSYQFTHSVVSNSLRPHEPQHAKPPCPSPTSRVYSNLCPSSQWCHPTISSSIVSFSYCL